MKTSGYLKIVFFILCVIFHLGIRCSDPAKVEQLIADGQTESGTVQLQKIFDENPKLIVVNGYSTSFGWPSVLQRKLNRYFREQRVIEVKSAVKGGTPIAKWIDVQTGKPKESWLTIVRPLLTGTNNIPIVVLAQQSLQWVYGSREEGIRTSEDTLGIMQGADAMEKYVKLMKHDGADLVFIATHIYKHEMEPVIGNEQYALDELIRRDIPNIELGPDVWTPTKDLYPIAFQQDLKHPNSIGNEIMAQYWFETLLKYDNLGVPAWSREEMDKAIKQ